MWLRQRWYPSPRLIVPLSYSISSRKPPTKTSLASGTRLVAILWNLGNYGSSATNTMTQAALTAVSSNRKTGAIPTSTSEKGTCPASCPFLSKGCYAKGGPQNIHWTKISEGERGTSWDQFCNSIRKLKRGQFWRHNVSGDLPHVNQTINTQELFQLIAANKGRKGYTYTHHDLSNDVNLSAIKFANASGFTINASTECIETADKVMSEHNIPAVAVINSEESRRFFKTESGRKVIVCPATIHDNVSCDDCRICADANRSTIVAFPAHGNAKKSVNNIIAKWHLRGASSSS